jgi:hypothetical protein
LIEGCYVPQPQSPEDHRRNFLVKILDISTKRGDMTEVQAVETYHECLRSDVAAQRFALELGTLANSRTIEIDTLLAMILSQDHENCTTGWL